MLCLQQEKKSILKKLQLVWNICNCVKLYVWNIGAFTSAQLSYMRLVDTTALVGSQSGSQPSLLLSSYICQLCRQLQFDLHPWQICFSDGVVPIFVNLGKGNDSPDAPVYIWDSVSCATVKAGDSFFRCLKICMFSEFALKSDEFCGAQVGGCAPCWPCFEQGRRKGGNTLSPQLLTP